ncbi:uncharacterized protein LOC119743397 isoform X2 [Patiria miniata]|nr:uncharacterized protein LOC119743397 isoform X2 [Patiria miniata]XP_038075715.1 uncharacterized protein LOC119743397 isoform X2 [Patiria miniata]XP_038075716.1 uncharacterized protein LOC119743397 isoform X2 [Patiria miniata]XP_038075717.1 uncharacterized protein LOC119743397 isoform X2 [Patiria miniata]XP_038075718.1 uncharacterized protein LOC119743397 isoform X2 [Patiria miniata]
MDPDEAAVDAMGEQAGGDNLLNPVTMATSLHPPDSSSLEDKNQNGTMSRPDASETPDTIISSASPIETGDEGAVFDEDSHEIVLEDETKDNNGILGVEDVGSREIETDEPASDFALIVNGDSQEMDDVRASAGGSSDQQGLTEESRPDGEGRRQRQDREDDEGRSKDQDQTLAGDGSKESSDPAEQGDLPDDPVNLKRHQRASLYRQGLKHQETEGNSEEALRCYLAAITGLTESEAFTELPQCLHQISNIYFEKKEYEKAVHFIQAEKMYYETALIDIVNLQKQFESNSEENNEDLTTEKGDVSSQAGPDSPEIIKAKEYENLAKLCLKESKPQLALEYCGKATKVYREVYGDSHPVTVGSLDLFTLIYADVGKKLYADAMQKFDAEEKVLETSSAESQPKKSDQETTAGEETTNELRQRSKDDSVIQPAAETDPQTRTEFEPAPQPEEQDDWVTTCLLMLLFLLITFLVLLIMSYFYCLGNERSSICHQFKGDLSYWYMKIKHYYLGFGKR